MKGNLLLRVVLAVIAMGVLSCFVVEASAEWITVGSGANAKINCVLHVDEPAAIAGLYVGGSFTWVGGKACRYIARWDGVQWRKVGDDLDGPVNAMAVYKSHLYVGGAFTSAGTLTVNNLARWNGIRWKTVGNGVNAPVHALTRHSTNLMVGGEFTKSGPQLFSRIARWNGSSFSGLAQGVKGPVYALQSVNSKLYAGGMFPVAGSATVNNIAYWSSNSWHALHQNGTPVEGVNGAVRALTTDGTTLYIGGEFTEAGGSPAGRFIAWSGTQWIDLGAGLNGTVRTLVFDVDRILVGGAFTQAEGTTIGRFAIYDIASGTWESLGHFNGQVHAVCCTDAGMYVVGAFTKVGVRTFNRVAFSDS